jgi:hypothetical protein
MGDFATSAFLEKLYGYDVVGLEKGNGLKLYFKSLLSHLPEIVISSIAGYAMMAEANMVKANMNVVDDVFYKIDESGFTIEANGKITGPHKGRGKGYRPEPLGGRSQGDHRGHLIPEGGVDNPKLVNVQKNIISESAKSNLGPKKKLDNLVSKIAANNPKSTIRFVARPLRQKGISRPFAVTYYIEKNGEIVYAISIFNK